MSGSGPPDDEHPTDSLGEEQLRTYVREVMGWTGYQAQAYVAVVKHGPLEPGDIVAMTEVPHGRVYNVMGELEGVAVNVQGRQPKRYQAQHPRSLLGDKQDAFNEKADSAKDHLELHFEVQRERQDTRHPAWVIPGISGTKRELLEGLQSAEDHVLMMEQSGDWLQSNEIRDLSRIVSRGVDIEIIGWSGWQEKLERLVNEAEVTAWSGNQIESSFAIIDDEMAILRVGRGDTGVKIEDQGTTDTLRTAFETAKQNATEIQSDA